VHHALSVILLALGLIAGCAGTGREHPIIGTWALNLTKSNPDMPTNLSPASDFTSTVTFSPDGTYRGVARVGSNARETSGTFRTEGADVYINADGHESKLLYEIRGSDLVVHDEHEPGVLIYDRVK